MRDKQFDTRNREMVARMADDDEVADATRRWIEATYDYEYSYHFEWMGVPIIQYPQDMVAMQEIIMRVRPRVIVETGIARGGSLIFYASLLKLLGGGKVVGIDIDLRDHNRKVLTSHELAGMLTLVDGSSTEESTVDEVRKAIGDDSPVLVILDSHHTHDHVLAEARAYGQLVSPGSYMVVFDTIVDELPPEASDHRDWEPGDSPGSAVTAYLEENPEFEVDAEIHDKLLITAARGGYLRRTGV